MRRVALLLLILSLVAGAGAYVWRAELGLAEPPAAQTQMAGRRGRGGARGPAGAEAVAVTADASRIADVPVIIEAVGTAQALNTVTIRSQVDGRLLELPFAEGQDVRRGDVIARIDPTIYRAQYDQAVAKKAQDEANLANARVDLERYTNLARTNFGSKQQADTQRATVAQLEAQVKADQGAIDNAKAYLDYTTITAPFDGRTGIRLVDVGNLVRAGDTTGLVTITQMKPMGVVFNLPQQNLRAVTAAAARGPLAVEALEADNRTVIETGRLEVVDNQVDQTTGTVRLKAVFPNPSLALWPGSFVNVRLTVDVTRGAVVVPTAAVQRGPTGAFVYGIAEDRAVLKPVTVARQTETLAVIASGVTPPERVVTTGFARLTEGDPVRVVEPEVAVPAPAAAASTPPRRPRRGDASGATREGRRGPEETRSGGASPPGGTGPESTGPDGRPRSAPRGGAAREGPAGPPPATAP